MFSWNPSTTATLNCAALSEVVLVVAVAELTVALAVTLLGAKATASGMSTSEDPWAMNSSSDGPERLQRLEFALDSYNSMGLRDKT